MIRMRPGFDWTDGSVIVFEIVVVFTGIMEVFPGMPIGVAILIVMGKVFYVMET